MGLMPHSSCQSAGVAGGDRSGVREDRRDAPVPADPRPYGRGPGAAVAARGAGCVCAVLLAGVLLGCQGVPPGGREMLARANTAYARGDYAAGDASAGEFLRRFASSVGAGEAYYLRGLCRVRLGQHDAARADFTAGAAAADRPELKAYCQAMLANLAYDRGEIDAALAEYAASVPYLPARPPTDEILFRYGVCLQRAGRWDQARHVFSRLLDAFATSLEADAARCRFAWRHDYFAIECGAFRRVDEANHAGERLRGLGLDASVEFVRLDGQAAWRVLSGRYPTYNDAAGDLSRVRAIEPRARIVP